MMVRAWAQLGLSVIAVLAALGALGFAIWVDGWQHGVDDALRAHNLSSDDCSLPCTTSLTRDSLGDCIYEPTMDILLCNRQ